MAHFYPSGAVVTIKEYALLDSDNLITAESATEIEALAGETKKLVSITKAFGWVLTHVGASDAEYSEYYIKIGTKETAHTKSPLGLFNTPHNLRPGLRIPKDTEVAYYVDRDAGASGAERYVAKFIGYRP